MRAKSFEVTPITMDHVAYNVGGVQKEHKRDTWATKIDFLLACIGFSVGLGNVWRFPYLVYKNGGGAFLIPYLICVVVGGIPLFFLEVAVGQFMSRGGVYAWTFCPLLQGIGWATTITMFFVNCYYCIILCWAFYYMFASFTTELPWESCDNYWNTHRCSTFDEEKKKSGESMEMAEMIMNTTADTMNTTGGDMVTESMTMPMNGTSPIMMDASEEQMSISAVVEFWEYKVLDISSGVDDMGTVKWDLLLTLILAWIVIYACIWKGVRATGKVVYFTATAPYLFMIILLIRMAFLDGAKDGVLFYLVPDFSKVGAMEVWVDAGTQVFFSYAIALGALTALGSYNPWGHNTYRDCIIFACVNSGTSLLAGFVIFMVLGFMAHEQGVDISEVAESGPGLAFIAYPKAVSQMPAAPVWSVCFFFMIILLGLDSQFVGVEGFVTSCIDTFPVLRRGKHRRELFIFVVCIINLCVGIPMVMNGGIYVFQLFDYYLGSRIILLIAFFMCISVAWVYGVDRFYDNIEIMIGFRINPYMKFGWLVMAPIYTLTIFILSGINYSELTYARPTETYEYPGWAIAVGWTLASISALFIPLTALYKIIKDCVIEGKPFASLLAPNLKPHQLLPRDRKKLAEKGIELEPEDGRGGEAYTNTGFDF